MGTLFVAEDREAAEYLEACEATLTPDPALNRPVSTDPAPRVPDNLPRPATPVNVAAVLPVVAEVRPMPRPDHEPEQGYFVAYRNGNGSFFFLIKEHRHFRFAL